MLASSDDNDCNDVDVNHPLHKISDFKSFAKVKLLKAREYFLSMVNCKLY